MLCSQTWLKSLSGLSYMALGLFEKTFKQFVYWSAGLLMQIYFDKLFITWQVKIFKTWWMSYDA